jgi:hypothetical protein
MNKIPRPAATPFGKGGIEFQYYPGMYEVMSMFVHNTPYQRGAGGIFSSSQPEIIVLKDNRNFFLEETANGIYKSMERDRY